MISAKLYVIYYPGKVFVTTLNSHFKLGCVCVPMCRSISKREKNVIVIARL